MLIRSCCAIALVLGWTPNGLPAEPSPLHDDAALHDVQFLGPDLGWAVGDRGVICHTADGGRSWQMQSSGVRGSLRSVCFLTDQHGWVVGGETTPYTGLSRGIVLATTDGGRSWRPLDAPLPPLHYVRFFDLENGIAVGEMSAMHATSVFQTHDGGRTWQELAGPRTDGWRTACFLQPEVGVVAGLRGKLSLVGNGQLLASRLQADGLRGFHAVSLQENDSGWLVGDGGLALTTTSGGVVWQSPPTPLPNELRDVMNFRAVATRGDKVWLAGQPGSVIWHSPDSGRTWQKQFTRQTVPINALRFVDEATGFAAGEMGIILRTDDGGWSWRPLRGSDRRTAVLAIHARPGQISMPLLVKLSAEEGFRSTVLLPVRRDLGSEATSRDLDQRVREAVVLAGGTASAIHWQFPVAVPGLDQDQERLIAEWNRRTDGRLQNAFLTSLVMQIRTWRPDIIVLDSSNDATTTLIRDAVLRAVVEAADPTWAVTEQELTGLSAWKVERVFVRLPDGRTGQPTIDPFEILPRMNGTLRLASAPAVGLLQRLDDKVQSGRTAYELIWPKETVSTTGFFTGLSVAPASDSRRELLPLVEIDRAQQVKIAQRQRNIEAYAERSLGDPQLAAQLLGQLNSLTDGLPDDQAADALLRLADQYEQQSHLELTEQVYLNLLRRYPQHLASRRAMTWLFHYWTSSEIAWQRIRTRHVTHTDLTSQPQVAARQIEQADYALQMQALEMKDDPVSIIIRQAIREEVAKRHALQPPEKLSPDALEVRSREDRLQFDSQDANAVEVRHWLSRAAEMAARIERASPALLHSPEIQFPLASLRRQLAGQGLTNLLPRSLQWATGRNTEEHESAMLLAAGEIAPAQTTCRRTATRPFLDGQLSEDCWQMAERIPLTVDEGESPITEQATILLLYDREFLYVAANVPRGEGTRSVGPEWSGRRHDADLSAFDRVSLAFDLDRDYMTFYTFEVDCRGQTAERCWNNTGWNPAWFVAADGDEQAWRFEVAIPLSELASATPARNAFWGLSVVRVLPAAGVQSWTHPAAVRPRPETFGRLKFE